MKMKKAMIVIISICFFTLMISCSNSNNTLKVKSSDYQGLKCMTEGEFDWETATSSDYPYYDKNCFVSLNENEELIVSDYDPSEDSYVFTGDNGYFVGVDLGEFDGWIYHYPYFSQVPEAREEVFVVSENCKGFLKINNRKAYLFTYDRNTEKGKIYLLQCPDKIWSWSLVAQLEGEPCAWYYNDEEIFVATTSCIVKMGANNEISSIVETGFIDKIVPNSIVKLKEKLYCGSPMGIYEYDMETNKETCYPMPYEKYCG